MIGLVLLCFCTKGVTAVQVESENDRSKAFFCVLKTYSPYVLRSSYKECSKHSVKVPNLLLYGIVTHVYSRFNTISCSLVGWNGTSSIPTYEMLTAWYVSGCETKQGNTAELPETSPLSESTTIMEVVPIWCDSLPYGNKYRHLDECGRYGGPVVPAIKGIPYSSSHSHRVDAN